THVGVGDEVVERLARLDDELCRLGGVVRGERGLGNGGDGGNQQDRPGKNESPHDFLLDVGRWEGPAKRKRYHWPMQKLHPKWKWRGRLPGAMGESCHPDPERSEGEGSL